MLLLNGLSSLFWIERTRLAPDTVVQPYRRRVSRQLFPEKHAVHEKTQSHTPLPTAWVSAYASGMASDTHITSDPDVTKHAASRMAPRTEAKVNRLTAKSVDAKVAQGTAVATTAEKPLQWQDSDFVTRQSLCQAAETVHSLNAAIHYS